MELNDELERERRAHWRCKNFIYQAQTNLRYPSNKAGRKEVAKALFHLHRAMIALEHPVSRPQQHMEMFDELILAVAILRNEFGNDFVPVANK